MISKEDGNSANRSRVNMMSYISRETIYPVPETRFPAMEKVTMDML